MRQRMHEGAMGSPREGSAGSADGGSGSPQGRAGRRRSVVLPEDSTPAAESMMSGVPHDGSPEGMLTHLHNASAAQSGHAAIDTELSRRNTYTPPPAPPAPDAPARAAPPPRRSERPWSAFDGRGNLGLQALYDAAVAPSRISGARTSPLPPRAEHEASARGSPRGGWRSAPATSRQASVLQQMMWMEQFAPSTFSAAPGLDASARRSYPGHVQARQIADAPAASHAMVAAFSPAVSGVTSASASRPGTSTSSRSAALDFRAGGASPPLLVPPDVPPPPLAAERLPPTPLDMQPRAMSMRTLKLLLDTCDDSPASVRAALCHTTPDFAPGLPGLTKLISKFSKEGTWRKALAVFRSVPALGLHADTTIMNAAIAACGVAQDATAARSIFDAMPAQGVLPDTITYKAMVMAFTRCHEWQECVEMFLHSRRSGVPMDAVTCMVLVTTVARAGHWQTAEDMFRISFSGSVTFRALDDLTAAAPPRADDSDASLHGQVRQLRRVSAAQQSGAHYLEQHVLAAGIDDDPMARSTCNAMLAAYIDAKQGSRGLALLMTMMRSGPNLTPDIVSFNAVLGAFAASGDVSRALSVLEAITVVPTIHTIRQLMTAALAAGQRDLTLELWDRALRSRVAPDTDALNLCLRALVEPTEQGSLWLEALRVLSVALKDDIAPPEEPRGGAGTGPVPSPFGAPGYEDRLARPPSGRSAQANIAEQLAYCLQGAVLAADASTMRVMMQAALRHGAPLVALRIFQCLVRHQVVPDVACVNLHLRALARLGEWLLAWHVLRNALRGVGVDLESLAIMARLLHDVASVAAEHSPGLLPHVHQVMDEIHVLQRILEQEAAAAQAALPGAPAGMQQEGAVLGTPG